MTVAGKPVTFYEIKEVTPKEEMVKHRMVQFKPLLPVYKPGHPWTARLLQSLSAAELRRLIAVHGLNALNAALAANAAKGVK